MGTCPIHPIQLLLCPVCLGTRGGAVSSPAKTLAARRNARQPRKRRKPREGGE